MAPRHRIQAQKDTQEALDSARMEMQNSKAQFEEHTDLLSARDAATSQDKEDREPERASGVGCNVEESSEVRSVAAARSTLEE